MTTTEDRGGERIAPFRPTLTEGGERQIQGIRRKLDHRNVEQVLNVEGYWISIE